LNPPRTLSPADDTRSVSVTQPDRPFAVDAFTVSGAAACRKTAPIAARRRTTSNLANAYGHGESTLGVQPNGEHRHRPAVAIECRIRDALEIQRHVRVRAESYRVVSLENLLVPRMRQAAVTDQ